MTSFVHMLVRAAALAPLFACAQVTEESPSGADGDTLTGWLGDEPHFVAQGRVNGEDIDMRLAGQEAADASALFCEREYVAPDDGTGNPDPTQAVLSEVKIIAPFTVNGEERIVELELKQHDFQADVPDTAVTIVPRDDAQPPTSDQMWLQWEWKLAADESDLYEGVAQDGVFVLGTFTGAPGPDGAVIPEGEGASGGFVDAVFGEGETMRVSVTAPCTGTSVELGE